MEKQKGFSLIEVIISIAFISIVFVGFVMSLGSVGKAVLHSDTRTKARGFVTSEMENVKSSSYVYAPGNGVASYTFPSLPAGFQFATLDRNGLQVNGQIYGIPWDVATNAPYIGSDPIDPGLQKVTIIVTYKNSELVREVSFRANR